MGQGSFCASHVCVLSDDRFLFGDPGLWQNDPLSRLPSYKRGAVVSSRTFNLVSPHPLFSYYRQNKKLQWAAYSVLVIMSLTSGYLTGIGNFLALDRVTAFAPFFFLGYFFSEKDLIEWLKTRQSLGIAVAGIVAGVLILFFFYDHLMPYQHIVYGTWYSELPVTQFPTFLQTKVWLVRLLWYLVAFSMTISLIRVMPSEQIPYLTRAGKRSLTIYIVHRPIRDILLSCGFIRRIHRTASRCAHYSFS